MELPLINPSVKYLWINRQILEILSGIQLHGSPVLTSCPSFQYFVNTELKNRALQGKQFFSEERSERPNKSKNLGNPDYN